MWIIVCLFIVVGQLVADVSNLPEICLGSSFNYINHAFSSVAPYLQQKKTASGFLPEAVFKSMNNNRQKKAVN